MQLRENYVNPNFVKKFLKKIIESSKRLKEKKQKNNKTLTIRLRANQLKKEFLKFLPNGNLRELKRFFLTFIALNNSKK